MWFTTCTSARTQKHDAKHRSGERNYIKTNGTYNYDGCYMKTLQGPYNHTGISLLDVTQKIKKEITLGRIYLW